VKKRINRLVVMFVCFICFVMLLPEHATAEEENTKVSVLSISEGGQEYGALYGTPYSEVDDSRWLTLKLGGRGLRIINDDNTDIVLIDKFGSVYIGGQLCNPMREENSTDVKTDFSYGFMYFLLIVTLLLSIYNFLSRKKG